MANRIKDKRGNRLRRKVGLGKDMEGGREDGRWGYNKGRIL